MPETPVVPFLPRSALFIRGMAAQRPSLAVLIAFAEKDSPVPPHRRHAIIEKLLRSLPALPPPMGADARTALEALTPEGVDALEKDQRGSGVVTLRKAWEPVIASLDDEADRAFAHRCGTLLVELFRRRVNLPGRKSAVFRKNA
ncbi:MAG TPA: hypothetical protein VL426_00470 [Candidatus Binatia bacterium]|nr:hypothetical protein [Candidatus Binatia bacterium]